MQTISVFMLNRGILFIRSVPSNYGNKRIRAIAVKSADNSMRLHLSTLVVRLSGPSGFTCWIFLCSGIQFYLLLSPYLCFVSLLYLILYVLGDDALISQGSFMQTKYLCVLIHI